MQTVLIITDGRMKVDVLESPTGRWFLAPDTDTTGYTTLPAAMLSAASYIATIDRAHDPHLTVRDVLWRTQPTLSYQQAAPRIQRALISLLTNLNPVRSRYANLRPGAYDHE